MLYIVATPIGNLSDITLRALEFLKKSDYILCEDTRITGLMLSKLGIEKPQLISFYDEVEDQKIPEVIKILYENKIVSLVSDSGTPIISDPGFKLVKKCRELNLPITSIPGPSAVINALVLSGLPCGRFSFLGFLPKKPGERLKILNNYKNIEGVKVVYESPFRIQRLIDEINNVCGDNTSVSICREMTKVYEEVISGNIVEVKEKINKRSIKGEMVVVFV